MQLCGHQGLSGGPPVWAWLGVVRWQLWLGIGPPLAVHGHGGPHVGLDPLQERPQEPPGFSGTAALHERQQVTFGEVIRQLRLLGGRPTHDLTDEELATDMSVAKAYVDTGLAELQRRLGDQGGLQVEEAYGGEPRQPKPSPRPRPRPWGGQSWLMQSWLLTVMSLLQEGEALLEEQNHLPDVVHAADVVALQDKAIGVSGPLGRSVPSPLFSRLLWVKKRSSVVSTCCCRAAASVAARVAMRRRRVRRTMAMASHPGGTTSALELLLPPCSGGLLCMKLEGSPPSWSACSSSSSSSSSASGHSLSLRGHRPAGRVVGLVPSLLA